MKDPVRCPVQALMEAVKSEGRGCGDVGRMCLVAEALAHLAACGPPVRDGALTGVLTLLVSRMSRVRTCSKHLMRCIGALHCDQHAVRRRCADQRFPVDASQSGHFEPATDADSQPHCAECKSFYTLNHGSACDNLVCYLSLQVRWHAAEQLYVQLLVESESPDAAPQEALQVLATCSWDGDVAAAKAARQRLYPLLGLQPPAVAAGKKCAAGRPAAAAAAKGGEGASYQMLIDTAARHR